MWHRFDFAWMAGVMAFCIILSVNPAYGLLGYFAGRALFSDETGEN